MSMREATGYFRQLRDLYTLAPAPRRIAITRRLTATLVRLTAARHATDD